MNKHGQNSGSNIYLYEMSKIGLWVMNHLFHIAGVSTLITCVAIIPDGPKKLFFGLKLLLVSNFGLAVLIRFFWRNLCCKVLIDTMAEKITFFRCFNKGSVEAPLRYVTFLFDKHFACLYRGQRFTIPNEEISRMEAILPPGIEIHYSKSLYGRYIRWVQNHFTEKSNRP